MKLKDFRKLMAKDIFSTAEAHVVCFKDDAKMVNLQLHQWSQKGDVIALKRGVYMFADAKPVLAAIAKSLYYPCYLSLEYALSLYGVLPEAAFVYTLVTPKATRLLKTPMGTFSFQKIKREAFNGFDATTLMADKEKALVDYFYLNSSRLEPSRAFWESSRLEATATGINFKKVFRFAKFFESKKLIHLLTSFKNYAESD